MYTNQIKRALESDPEVSRQFAGVFASDRLPLQVTEYPRAFVVNTDPASERGEHWVCYYFDRNGNAEYFDTYGLPPSNCNLWTFFQDNGKNHQCNWIPIQGVGTRVCGHYCIAFLAKRVRGKSMATIVDELRGSKQGANDTVVAKEVDRVYNAARQRGGGRECIGQCCCAHIKRRAM